MARSVRHAPVIRLENVVRTGDDASAVVVFDDEAQCVIEYNSSADEMVARTFRLRGLGAADIEPAAAQRVVDSLTRIAEWMEVRNGALMPASVGRVCAYLEHYDANGSSYSAACGDVLLRADLSDLENAPYYVLSDEHDFGRNRDYGYLKTTIAPCASYAQACDVAARLSRGAVQPPYDWDSPRYDNVRIHDGPLVPLNDRYYSLLPMGAGAWVWQPFEEIPPPDITLKTREIYENHEIVNAGIIDAPDGALTIKDPTYGEEFPEIRDSKICVMPGRYDVTVGMVDVRVVPNNVNYGRRVSGVMLRHRDHAVNEFDLQTPAFCVPVDGGRVSVISDATRTFKYGDIDRILELGDIGWVEPNGFVTSSGMGDGSYPVLVSRNDDGAIVGLAIVFLEDAFSYTAQQPRHETKLDPPVYYQTVLGQVDSFVYHLRQHHRNPGYIAKQLVAAAGALRSAEAGDHRAIESIPEDVLAAYRGAEASHSDAYEARATELLHRVVEQIDTLRSIPSLDSLTF